ncbi:hypothetical protein ACH9L7_16425 (plasmid) [Haloferax sp. S1W]|uniref:hypothetical protein n=1 Tax=Haloferax sp. S1W TaxID=3377110 RepID=UPI0037C6CBE8
MSEPREGDGDGVSSSSEEGQHGVSEGRTESFVTRVLQYEWADTIVTDPPETDGISWVPGNVGESCGRIAPNVWSPGRELGFDLYFTHYPTPKLFSRGTFRFELTIDGVEGEPRTLPDGVDTQRLRQLFADRVARADPTESTAGSWVESSLVEDDERLLWKATYNFSARDEVAYYETLRTAIEDHAWIVPLVADIFHSMADDSSV